MLFDLRGSGRRTTVKVVYVLLAVLMGGGLVLFGIGGSVSGGLVDAITGSSGSSTQRRRARSSKRADAGRSNGRARTRRTPRPGRPRPAPATSSRAPATTSTRAPARSPPPARRSCGPPPTAWEKHLALEPKQPDDSVASHDGPGLRPVGPERARQGRHGAGDHHRGAPEVGDLRQARRSSPTRPARPARATSRRKQGARRWPTRPTARRSSPTSTRPSSRASSSRSRTRRRPRPPRRRPTGRRSREAAGTRGAVARVMRRSGAPVAQLAEQRTLNPKVPGSIPGGGTAEEGPRSRAFCLLAGQAFAGDWSDPAQQRRG